ADSLRHADEARAIEAARAALLAAVYFDFDRSEIRQPDRPLLERKSALLTLNRPVRLRVEGNTDERGSDEYNLALGMRRAAEIRRFLMTQGIDSSRVAITSSGEERPACREQDDSCRSRNRRAEFTIVAGAERIVAEQRRP
ncbi:MAG: OmpA family protein, partial [bacterium]